MNDISKVPPWHPLEVFRQAIRERAYFIWEHEGRPPGRNIANWLQAEAEIERDYNDVGGFVRSWADVVAAGDWEVASHLR